MQPLWAQTGGAATGKPNILVVLMDDVGYSDVGAFGSEIPTPAIDALANSGMKFTDFHPTASCSPTRSMLLTGVDNHQAGFGNMAETLLPEQVGKPGYEGHLNDRVVTTAELLKDRGYHTYITGKWHLGGGDSDPYRRGFEESFVVMNGFSGHFEPTPAFEGNTTTYTHNGEKTQKPAEVYSSQFYTDQMIAFIDAHKADGKPFFGYLAFTAAHDPLQAPADTIAKFKDKYMAGYEALRTARVERMKSMGLWPADAKIARREPEVKAWDQLTAEEKAFESRQMEVYAAMVSNIDDQVGRVLDHLRTIGAYDNTVVILASDNGPNPETIAFYGADWINQHYDNSIGNLGNHNSFIMYGAGWAQAGAGPYRLFKGFIAEGGTRTPLIISGPGVKQAGQTSSAFVHVLDLAPTILEMAGVSHPATFADKPVLPLQGTSMVSHLQGTTTTVHSPDQAMGWEIWGRGAVRQGGWKLVWIEKPHGNSAWALFNLATDPIEENDLAQQEPEKFNELMAAWEQYVKDNGIILALGKGMGE
ncbi:MAG: arylsulfatase [Gammaproteobacteria bacterium]